MKNFAVYVLILKISFFTMIGPVLFIQISANKAHTCFCVCDVLFCGFLITSLAI